MGGWAAAGGLAVAGADVCLGLACWRSQTVLGGLLAAASLAMVALALVVGPAEAAVGIAAAFLGIATVLYGVGRVLQRLLDS